MKSLSFFTGRVIRQYHTWFGNDAAGYEFAAAEEDAGTASEHSCSIYISSLKRPFETRDQNKSAV
jgi:hypothetical protein